MFGTNAFAWGYFADGFAGGGVPRTPLILRITGFLSGMWFRGSPSAEMAADLPGGGWSRGRPSGDMEADIPDDEWGAGKPR